MNISISFCLHFYMAIVRGLVYKLPCFRWLKDGKLCLIIRDMQVIDLWKAFNTIKYELLTHKLHTHGFSKETLKLTLKYLECSKQRVKVKTTFSSWVDLICRVLFDWFVRFIFETSSVQRLFECSIFFLNDIKSM